MPAYSELHSYLIELGQSDTLPQIARIEQLESKILRCLDFKLNRLGPTEIAINILSSFHLAHDEVSLSEMSQLVQQTLINTNQLFICKCVV